MDAVDSVVEPLREFAKDIVRLVKRCHKPDRKGKDPRARALPSFSDPLLLFLYNLLEQLVLHLAVQVQDRSVRHAHVVNALRRFKVDPFTDELFAAFQVSHRQQLAMVDMAAVAEAPAGPAPAVGPRLASRDRRRLRGNPRLLGGGRGSPSRFLVVESRSTSALHLLASRCLPRPVAFAI
ncbi:hypothetical protein ZWY2020_012860 [Hordeum vulgare]|nr:hypothetical protein ZWY2020_012860 [Hordeum vulgare]